MTGKPKTPGKVIGKEMLPKGRWGNYMQKVQGDFIQTETGNVHYGLAARQKLTMTETNLGNCWLKKRTGPGDVSEVN